MELSGVYARTIKHLYISPLELCNLRCQMCYTNKTKQTLTNEQILDFATRYQEAVPLQSVTLCGGEVFIMPKFPKLVNELVSRSIYVQIISNGTIDRLDEILQPNFVNLIVSLDGLPTYHNKNRGERTFEKSLKFMEKAFTLGFHVEVFSIVTKENMNNIDEFERLLDSQFQQHVPVTYHPRKPFTYLTKHPVSNQLGTLSGFSIPDAADRKLLASKHEVFPPQTLGCYQISLMSDGNVYGCCEGIKPLGRYTDEIHGLLKAMKERLRSAVPLACVEPDFVCGLEEYYVA